MSSTESEDTELGFNHGAQCFIRALSMEHSAAAEAEQQRCAAECRSTSPKNSWEASTPRPTQHNAGQQSVREQHQAALRLHRRAFRGEVGKVPRLLHNEVRAMQARPAATALHVWVFAANEARDAASLSGLDFKVHRDLDGRPAVEVHLPPRKGPVVDMGQAGGWQVGQ